MAVGGSPEVQPLPVRTAPGPFQIIAVGQPNAGPGVYPIVMISAFAVPSSIFPTRPIALTAQAWAQSRASAKHGTAVAA